MKKSKEELLMSLTVILLEPFIKTHIDEIADIRSKLLDYTTDSEELNISNKIREKIQHEARQAWEKAGRRGAIIIATGVGKSKIAIDILKDIIATEPFHKVVLSVPTEKLRDEGWKNEFNKWGASLQYNYVYRTCYASLGELNIDRNICLTVLDEGHNITEANSKFFENHNVRDILFLSATRPTDPIKLEILRKLGIHPVYELALDEAVKLGIVAPYDITIVEFELDNEDKYVKLSKKSKVLMTEKEAYNYYTKMTIFSQNSFSRINRMRFIYDCKSKGTVAIRLLQYKILKDLRRIIFCGSKSQAIILSPYRYFSKPTIKPKDAMKDDAVKKFQYLLENYQGDSSLNRYISGEINEIACVTALNEGHNLGQTDIALVVQLNSKQLHFIQRIGRILRYTTGHVGKIIILMLKNTVDEEWCEKAIKGLDRSKIRRVSLEDIRTGKEQLIVDKVKQDIEPERKEILELQKL